MNNEILLEPISTDPGRLAREAAIRRRTYERTSVSKSQVDEYLDNGWALDRELKIKTRLRRERNCDEMLENRKKGSNPSLTT